MRRHVLLFGLLAGTESVVVHEVLVPAPTEFVRDQSRVATLGLTPRQLEILEFIAAGLSNMEIAERAFVSANHGQDAFRTHPLSGRERSAGSPVLVISPVRHHNHPFG